jgi:hypothetical protein
MYGSHARKVQAGETGSALEAASCGEGGESDMGGGKWEVKNGAPKGFSVVRFGSCHTLTLILNCRIAAACGLAHHSALIAQNEQRCFFGAAARFKRLQYQYWRESLCTNEQVNILRPDSTHGKAAALAARTNVLSNATRRRASSIRRPIVTNRVNGASPDGHATPR